MKKIWIATLAIAVMAIALVGLAGCSDESTFDQGSIVVNTNSQQTGISVSGEGKVYATPDLAILIIGVEAQAKTVAEANTQAADAMNALLKALKDAGLQDKDIQTS
ncbi:MAG: DUF541 domain-containing protein, partial [Chloroflexi bacterium]|nr:DUF541 domain-containing protein [Chloroflexota bacterium]